MPKAVDTLKTKRLLKHDGVLYEYFSLPEAARPTLGTSPVSPSVSR